MTPAPRRSGFLRGMLAALWCAAATVLCSAESDTAAPPFVGPVFGDHMVLQRGKPNTFWGWARAGEEVRVTIGDQAARATAGADGRWQASITPPPPGGPYTVTIEGPQTVVWHDVLVGDVWLCSGQSNMEFALARARDGARDVQAADHPRIRLFHAANQVAYAPASTIGGAWQVCSPETVAPAAGSGFSAVAYYFGLKLQAELGVPIGLIQAAVGGTPAESWTSAEALRPLGDFNAALDEIARLHAKGGPEYGNFLAHWYDEFDVGQREGWSAPGTEASAWTPVGLPGGFPELGVPETPAVAYFRRTIELPDPLPSGAARLQLGQVERMDTAWINGRWIGASAWVENPRDYSVPAGVLRPGRNEVVLRVFKTRAKGGFLSPADQLRLRLGDGTAVPLAGEWSGRLAVDARPPHPLPAGFENWPTMPSVLYNGMIAPLAPLAISGAVWYQGESNVGRAAQYRVLLPAMIADWRRAFGQGDFPFYIVSLAAFQTRRDAPGDDGWAELREAQAWTSAHVPNSGLALAIDLGDAQDIHPVDKRPVGERLALCALANHYGRAVPFSGPVLRSVEPIPGALRLRFDHADGGLVVRGETLAEFSIRAAGGPWVWADARLDGDTVVVSSAGVPEPRDVRYAWQANPRATLFNAAGLPAAPFRTDGGPAASSANR